MENIKMLFDDAEVLEEGAAVEEKEKEEGEKEEENAEETPSAE